LHKYSALKIHDVPRGANVTAILIALVARDPAQWPKIIAAAVNPASLERV
jgi:hypothetical protein